ncbi:hypothetical protein GQ53DRAFT_749488 [Thozetella sp. PMI_491]|nr:hypothetical protein GQ53DRAFT_749488 [Thozetella sp. PMI_491]
MPFPSGTTFPATNLPQKIQADSGGKRRKTKDGRAINLAKDCELLGLVQYECEVANPELPECEVACYPVQRWFRRCQDKKGSFMVETTAWEGRAARQNIAETPGGQTKSAPDTTPQPTEEKRK